VSCFALGTTVDRKMKALVWRFHYMPSEELGMVAWKL